MRHLLLYSVLYGYYLLLLKTCRIERAGWEKVDAAVRAGRGSVFGAPHCVLLPCVLSFDGLPATLLASLSKDGEIIARILEKRGFQMVRGSSSRGGAAALESLLSDARGGGTLGITFDGPRGPAMVPKPGVGLLAWQTGNVFLLAHVKVRRRTVFPGVRLPFAIRLGSWDRFVLPLPFAHFEVTFEEIPVEVPHGERRAWIDAFLARLGEATRRGYEGGIVGP